MEDVKGGKYLKISPAAQNLIQVQHIDPAMIQATGPKGLILKEDVVKFVESSAGVKDGKEEVRVEKVEVKVQENKEKNYVKEDKSDVRAPRFSVTTYINLEKPLSLFQESHLRPFLIKAASSSCKAVPESHSKFFPSFTRFYDYIDTQVYVYSSNSVQKYFIQDTQTLSTSEISSSLSSESSGSANFEISFGTNANEVSNPRTSSLLSLSPIQEQVISSNNELKSIKTIKATLNCDHRAVDGAVGANWLKSFKQFVENPVSLI
jgi:pyruvate dehydrogenase E2 component (dihydrolipoamide acetyltransferase)